MKLGHKKGFGQLNLLITLAIGLVVAGLVAAFGAQIVASIQSGMEADSVAYNATGDVLDGIANMTGQFGNVGLVAAAVVVIGLLVGGFMVFGKGSR